MHHDIAERENACVHTHIEHTHTHKEGEREMREKEKGGRELMMKYFTESLSLILLSTWIYY